MLIIIIKHLGMFHSNASMRKLLENESMNQLSNLLYHSL